MRLFSGFDLKTNLWGILDYAFSACTFFVAFFAYAINYSFLYIVVLGTLSLTAMSLSHRSKLEFLLQKRQEHQEDYIFNIDSSFKVSIATYIGLFIALLGVVVMFLLRFYTLLLLWIIYVLLRYVVLKWISSGQQAYFIVVQPKQLMVYANLVDKYLYTNLISLKLRRNTIIIKEMFIPLKLDLLLDETEKQNLKERLQTYAKSIYVKDRNENT